MPASYPSRPVCGDHFMIQSRFTRILLKLSGESLRGRKTGGIHPPALKAIASDIESAHQQGVQIAIVIGGGNIFRGAQSPGFPIHRVTADYMGMIATIINALALSDSLKSLGASTMVMSALEVSNVVGSERSGTWRKEGLSFLQAAPETLMLPLIPPPPCVL